MLDINNMVDLFRQSSDLSLLLTPSHPSRCSDIVCGFTEITAGTVADLHSVPSLTKPLFGSEAGCKDK